MEDAVAKLVLVIVGLNHLDGCIEIKNENENEIKVEESLLLNPPLGPYAMMIHVCLRVRPRSRCSAYENLARGYR